VQEDFDGEPQPDLHDGEYNQSMHRLSIRLRTKITLWTLPTLVILLIISLTPGVFAQTSDDGWSEPFNLSHRAAAANRALW